MPAEQGRVAASITVGGTSYTHILTASTPPSPDWNLAESQAGVGMSYPIKRRLNPLNYTFDVEGDYAELRDMDGNLTISYEETLRNADGQGTDITVDYEMTGIQVSAPRAQYVANANGLPTVTHNLRLVKFKDTHGSTVQWDIDLTVDPPKIQFEGRNVVAGAAS